MSREIGHYLVKEGDHLMVVWYAGSKFYKVGNTRPHSANEFDEIAEEPMELSLTNAVKGTKW